MKRTEEQRPSAPRGQSTSSVSPNATCTATGGSQRPLSTAATAVATFLARTGKSMDEIRAIVVRDYYPLDFTLDEIRPTYEFDESCQGSVPQALEAFFESTSFEDAIRNAVSIGGDSDTLAAITGAVAGAFYGVPEDIRKKAETFLDEHLLKTLHDFEQMSMATI